jgi:hypothetical protein
MKKTFAAVLSLALVLCVGAVGTVTVNAADVSEIAEGVPPIHQLAYINATLTSIGVSGGQATCVGHISGYPGLTTKVTITLYLERKKASSNNWTTFANSTTQTFNSYSGTYQWKKAIDKGYQYRTRAVYVAYAGSKSEVLTGYSSVVAY